MTDSPTGNDNPAGRGQGCDCGCHAGPDSPPPVPDGMALSDTAMYRVPVQELLDRGSAPDPGMVEMVDWSGSTQEVAMGRLLDACAANDNIMRVQVAALLDVLDTNAAQDVFGVDLDVVLSQTGRYARWDANRMLRAANLLARMPAFRDGFMAGHISWAQVNSIVAKVRTLPVGRYHDIDALIGQLAEQQVEWEADTLVHEIDWAVAEILAELDKDKASQPIEHNTTWFDDRPDGSGVISHHYDRTRYGPAKANIQALASGLEDIPHIDHDAIIAEYGDRLADHALTDAHTQAAKIAGRNAARCGAAAFELLTGWNHDTLAPQPDGDGTGNRTGRPGLLLTANLADLIDGTAPARLVNTLTSQVLLDADTANLWSNIHGADVRLIIMNNGEPIGVGHTQRQPPGWLHDAVVARDIHDTAPRSTTSAQHCDVDHVHEHRDGGPTDVDNLALVSRRWHTRKTNRQLDVTRRPDGTTTWTVRATGYTIRTRQPATWQGRTGIGPQQRRPPPLQHLDTIPPACLDQHAPP